MTELIRYPALISELKPENLLDIFVVFRHGS